MERDPRSLLRYAALLAAGLLGGVVALVGAASLGKLGGTTTIREVSPEATRSSVSFRRETGLTPGATDHLFHVDAENPQALNAVLDKARAAGALLVELKRDGQDLEAVLTSAVGVAA